MATDLTVKVEVRRCWRFRLLPVIGWVTRVTPLPERTAKQLVRWAALGMRYRFNGGRWHSFGRIV